MKVYLFPGQGSQQKGMGEELFDEFRDITQAADDILGYSIKELCIDDPGGNLVKTQYTQPALFTVNAMNYLARSRESGIPAYVAGHSVGEFSALFAAEVIDFETGLKLVKKRGELMSQAKGGGMAAVLGMDQEKVAELIEGHRLETLHVANYNSSFQIVISGPKADIESAEPLFLEGGATHYRVLNVSGAFHTPFMEPAKKKFKRFAKKFQFNEPRIPVISNVTARPYEPGSALENIVEQITSPVRWTETVRYLLAMGAGPMAFDEMGPGGVLKGLVMRINHEAGPLDLTAEQEESAAVEESAASFFQAESLGDPQFKKDYNLRYAYLGGGMYRGIASKEMVVRFGKSGMLGFLGTGAMKPREVEEAIVAIQKELSPGQPYGMNLVATPGFPHMEEELVDLFIRQRVPVIEAAAFMTITPALVKYRAKGLTLDGGVVTVNNRIIAKVSRPEVAEHFLKPAPERVVKKLLDAGKITATEVEALRSVPMADDLCVEADSGGHTDMGVAYALMPAMIALRDRMMKECGYRRNVRVGAAGGIGTPEAAAAAFVLGADFVVTGSINQCTVEAGTSDVVKDMLQEMNVQDTDYAPAGDMFELGARVQVLKRGVFFPARANKLYDLYRQFNSLDELDSKTRQQLQQRYFKKNFDEIYNECRLFYPPEEIKRADQNPKHKMALVFRWYFGYSSRLALSGNTEGKVDFQVNCGPALGAFNQWVKGGPLENWRNRHVDEIGQKLMRETAELLNRRFQRMAS
jgi:trans-AT polyketide synthase/acyltransferase/oxidoreductase domain-containing protein